MWMLEGCLRDRLGHVFKVEEMGEMGYVELRGGQKKLNDGDTWVKVDRGRNWKWG